LAAGRGWWTRTREEDEAEEAGEVFREEEADRRRGARSCPWATVTRVATAAVVMGDKDKE